MRRFRFRLDRLARVRRIAEETARGEWAAGERAARTAEAERGAAARERERLRADLRRRQLGSVDPRLLLAGHETARRLAAEEERRGAEAETLRWQAGRLRDEWQRLERDRRALDELEQRERRRHTEALRAEEQRETDEVAAVRHARRAGDPAGGPLPGRETARGEKADFDSSPRPAHPDG